MSSSRVGQVALPVAVVGIVVMMVIPLPTILLDFLLAVNITGALLILLVAMYVKRPLDFAIFPALLLIATMFRLALNVSATRLVLLDGYAGKVIEAFGHFVVGGSLVVGMVIFFILVVIQFLVITNGAGRVAEVGARFTLDAMPGKQMAIDADLNAGLIDEDTARQRRADVTAEADFYGAMDGASKFVKGDAMAAIVITLVNLLGGFIIGVVQKKMPIAEAIETYSLLSIGDGLVSQIPALLISIASGLIVTRATTNGDMGSDLISQFSRQRKAMRVAGFAVLGLALIPGIPKLPFLVVGGTVLLLAARLNEAPEVEELPAPAELPAPSPDSPEQLAHDMRVEPLELEVAYDLVDLVDTSVGGDLLERVRALRRKLALDLGMVIPLVRTRDNLELPPGTYAIKVNGVEMARGQAPPGAVLAIGDDLGALPGTPTTEPVFGLAGKWVPMQLRQQAELAGATVVDRASVITTHLSEVVRSCAGRLLGREDVKMLTDMVKATHPVVIEELTPALLSLGEIQRTLQGLLDEDVAIRDLVRIFEAMGQRARISTDPEGLVEAVRATLGPAISTAHAANGRLPVLTFDPMLEQGLLECLRGGDGGTFLALDGERMEHIALEVHRLSEEVEQRGDMPVLACAPQLRPAVQKLIRVAAPRLPVLSYGELGNQLQLETVGVVRGVPAVAA
ncbi:MAG: flagellar biosynthesis protein FlhA [Actinomycetota bacterium]|nr:flagellar biosynthesis protein FlhA [Actinomycetota bacterium]